MRYSFLAVPLVFVSCLAQAQDASLLAGAMRVDQNPGDSSFAVALGYHHHLNKYLAVSADYLNEGHPKAHHRDGLGAQLWVHTAVPQRGWSVAAGIGPYYYFDTITGSGSPGDYRNDHGWGQLMSLSAKYHLSSNAYLEARLAHTHGMTSHDSTMLLFGAGYELRKQPLGVRLQNGEKGGNLLMLLGGRSIVNSFKSETATSYGVEYRRTVNPNVEWSVTAMSEGKVDAAERKGVSGQLWLLRPFTERTALQMGFGAYAMRDQLDRTDPHAERAAHLAPIASIGARYRISDTWRAQFTWSRVITDYERDSDVFMLGAGVVF